jgi:hypothetical protein
MINTSFVTLQEVGILMVITLLSYVFVSRLTTIILLSSWFADFYYDHLFQLNMDAAYAKSDATKIDSNIYKAKLTQLGAHRINLRELALGFFENAVATPQLVTRLIEVLPRQGKSEIQIRMARLLVTTLEKLYLRSPQVANPQEAKRLDLENRTAIWARVICYLVPVVGAGCAAWLNFDRMRVEVVLLFSIAVWAAVVVILRFAIRSNASYLRAIVVTAGGIAGALWLYAAPHTDLVQTPTHFLNEVGLNDVAVYVKHPKWITEEDIISCSNKLSVLTVGTYPNNADGLTFDFEFGQPIISLLSSDCYAPPTHTISSKNCVADYYTQLQSAQPLFNYQTILVTPTVRTQSALAQPIPIGELSFQMGLEHPFWGQIRQTGLLLTGASAGSTLLLYIAAVLYKKITGKQA